MVPWGRSAKPNTAVYTTMTDVERRKALRSGKGWQDGKTG